VSSTSHCFAADDPDLTSWTCGQLANAHRQAEQVRAAARRAQQLAINTARHAGAPNTVRAARAACVEARNMERQATGTIRAIRRELCDNRDMAPGRVLNSTIPHTRPVKDPR